METKGLAVKSAVLFALLSPSPVAPAQLESYVIEPKPPQAQSREELRAYLDVTQAAEPQRTIELGARFVQNFPRSEFLAQVYRRQMHAHRNLGDAERTIQAGEKARSSNPFDVDTLLTLASVLPGQSGETRGADTVLDRAEDYALRALQELATLKASRSVRLANWLAFLRRQRASAHESLGVVAFQRGEYRKSVQEFELSTQDNLDAEGSQLFRLGVAYQYVGENEKAISALERAVELGPDVVSAKAQAQLQQLRKPVP